MRFLCILLLLPCLLRAECGDCSDVEKELEKERQRDKELHACRSCKALDITYEACPWFGYDCQADYAITFSQLTNSNQCQCLEARCAGPTAKLSVAGKLVNKVRCNNSQWMNGATPAGPAICAKPCNAGVCKAAHPKASADFTALQVVPATSNSLNPCATGECANGMVALNDDGTLKYPLDWIPPETNVVCTGDGVWKYGDEEKEKHVMCNASPCGPSRCASFIFGEGMITGAVVPLTVTGNGEQCAFATCEVGYVRMNADGGVVEDLMFMPLTCGVDGLWRDMLQRARQYVMCTPPPCPNGCDETPFEATALTPPVTLNKPTRRECSYTCPDDQALFYNTGDGPVSIEGATCEGGRYRINPTFSVEKIGCWVCDLEDGEIAAESDVKPQLSQCVLWCPEDYVIEYWSPSTPEIKTQVNRLYRRIYGQNGAGKPNGAWFDAQTNNEVHFTNKLACIAK